MASSRGADVYAYLTRAHGRRAATLATNWRSDEGLLRAPTRWAELGDEGIVPERMFPLTARPRRKLGAGDDTLTCACTGRRRDADARVSFQRATASTSRAT